MTNEELTPEQLEVLGRVIQKVMEDLGKQVAAGMAEGYRRTLEEMCEEEERQST